ncbi:taperin [Ambystoma mexicanum]|uniref:taperin n=1 Tax=Ambystoma mexicanum TaxID=8296 RepID=UPI0037E744A8
MSAASPEPAGGRPIPAWKRTILERKRAKLAGGAREPSPGRGYTGSRSPTPKPSRDPAEESETGVLQESLGPLRQNPFIRLEQERRRRRQQHPWHPPSPTTPIQQLLDLYSHVPGIRTIRAENILIIESDDDYSGASRASSHPNPLEELLSRRGSKVTEIRASEVVIYEPLSRSHEDLLCPDPVDEAPGRVSRLRARFNQGKPKPQRSRSTDSLLDGDHYPKLLEALTKPSPRLSSNGSAEGAFCFNSDAQRYGNDAQIYEDDTQHFTKYPGRSMSTPTPDPSPGLSPSVTPTSPLSSPGSVTCYSPSSPFESWSPDRFELAQEILASSSVPSFKERFENYTMLVNQPQPHSKLKDFSQKTGNNTIKVNPRAPFNSKVNIPNGDDAPSKETTVITNGHASRSELETMAKETVNIQDLLSKTKKEHPGVVRTSGGRGQAPPPPTSNHELLKGAKTWRPKSEITLIRSKFSSKPSATVPEMATLNNCKEFASSATPNQQRMVSSSTSPNQTFEIKPAPKPDLASIPDEDIQAKALANIRMQSKNSFVFIPKRRPDSFVLVQDGPKESKPSAKPNLPNSASTFAGRQTEFTYLQQENSGLLAEDERNSQVTLTHKATFDAADVGNPKENSLMEDSQPTLPVLSDFDWNSGLLSSSTESNSFIGGAAELEYFNSVPGGEPEGCFAVPVTSIHDEEFSRAELPITYIDDIVHSEPIAAKSDSGSDDTLIPAYRPHTGPSEIQFKGGNTFTIVPKRKPVVSQYETFTRIGREREEDEENDTGLKNRSSEGSEAPYSELGMLLKKRYPTVDEIEVIGGYQSLKKSCLTKNVSTRKKMKISFNETSIQTMFEYPSESSLAEGDQDEEEDDDDDGSASEAEEEKPYSLFLPRPSFITSTASNNSLRPNSSNSGFSSYTPKHSVEYSKWQEKKYEEKPSIVDSPNQGSDHDRKNMLTPADSNSLSDFNSEPALYF